ncbi:hypothetical protein C8F01DRAFT_1120365 [Mycena amicta]|nr:hypothetical protein C8F01DRAFT_1120365 [Mycena amicta]
MSGKRPSSSRNDQRKKKYRSDGTPIWGRPHIEGPGVWVTCVKGKEKQAAGEARELFQNLASQLWPDTKEYRKLSIEQQIANEVNAMKSPKAQDLFKNCPTDTPCVVFISCRPPVDPVRLVEQHVKSVDETGVTHTSVANLSEIEAVCRATFAPVFSGGTYKYKIELKLRNHTTLSRDPLIAAIAKCVPQDGGHGVDLINPDLVILVEVFKCGVSVVRDYHRLKKFNVTEIASAAQGSE